MRFGDRYNSIELKQSESCQTNLGLYLSADVNNARVLRLGLIGQAGVKVVGSHLRGDKEFVHSLTVEHLQ